MADLIMTDADGVKYSYENIKTQGWLDGHESGLDAAIGWLNERAVTLFRNGKDELAVSMRRLAEDMDRALRLAMQERSKRHRIEFPATAPMNEDE